MSMTVKCWMADEGDHGDEESATDVEAHDAERAAEKFVEGRWGDEDYPTSCEVMTRDSFNVVRRFHVEVESEPVFSATDISPPATPPESPR
jgi:hypothetical protein